MSNRKGGRLWARQLFQSGNRQAFVAGTVVGAAIVLALTSQQHKPVKSPDAKVKAPPPPPPLAPRVPVPAPVAAPHPTPLKPSLVDSMPVDSDVVVRKAYTVRYDRRTRNPVWVSELLTRDSLKGETVRDNMRFMEDPAIPERFRSRLDDYRCVVGVVLCFGGTPCVHPLSLPQRFRL
jgi:DNA/RNA endonuclease G (NUC1)